MEVRKLCLRRISTFQHIFLKVPNGYEQLLNGIFGDVCCFESFQFYKFSNDKAEDDTVFHAEEEI